MKRAKNPLFLVLAFIGGAFATLLTTVAFAHGGDTSKIHGCVRNNGLLNGFVRIIDANANCNNNETPLDWPKENAESFISCNECTLADVQIRYDVPTTTNQNFNKALLDFFNVPSTDFSGSTFVNARLRGANFQNATLTNTNWSNAKLGAGYLAGSTVPTDFSDANLTGANFSNAVLDHDAFTSANLTNVNFTNADLRYSYGLDSATLTGITWSNTLCPDTTNSNDNGNTCVGHLNP